MIDKDWNLKKEILTLEYDCCTIKNKNGDTIALPHDENGDDLIYSPKSIDKLRDVLYQDIDYYARNFDQRAFQSHFIKCLVDSRLGIDYRHQNPQ